MLKKYIKLFWGLTPPTPFVTSIEADFALMHRVNTRAKYMQVQVVSLYISKKCIAAANWMQQNNSRWGQSAWLVRLTRAIVPSGPVRRLFQRCAAFSLRISGLD